MRHKAAGMRNELYYLISQQIRFYGRDTITFNTFYLVQRLHQVEESLSGALAEIANVNTGQHNLLSPFGCSLTRLFYHRGNRSVAAPSASKRNGAIGTIIIATILYFQKIASTISP